jgi:hypothetical protein
MRPRASSVGGPRWGLCGYGASMLLFASSNQAAHAVTRAITAVGTQAGVGRERAGRFPISVMVSDDRDVEVLDIAKAVDPAVQAG